MTNKTIDSILTTFIASVWVVNGLYCKVFGLTPRHEQIVAEILGAQYAKLLTIAIGALEIALAVWFVSRIKQEINAYLQMALVAIMNVIEIVLVPHLLLWGYFNIIFAWVFMAIVYYHTFILRKQDDLRKTV